MSDVSAATPQALSGVRVISFAQLAQGPLAAQMLGDLGAEVIKIERPRTGEFERNWTMLGEFVEGESISYWSYNRNKKSLTLDLKTPLGKEIALQLAETADVLIENFRPGVMDRLGLGYEELNELNPGLIYASATGFGSSGPYVDKAGQDLVLQAMGGLASLNGRSTGPPVPVGTNIADVHGANLLAFSIVSALFYRERSGKGQKVEANMLSSILDLQAEELVVYMNTGIKPERSAAGVAHPYMEAPYGLHPTADGYLALSMSPLTRVLDVAGATELGAKYCDKDVLVRRDEIMRDLGELLSTRSTAEWLELFEAHDIWCAPVNDYEALVNDPQVAHNTAEAVVAWIHASVIGIANRIARTIGTRRAVQLHIWLTVINHGSHIHANIFITDRRGTTAIDVDLADSANTAVKTGARSIGVFDCARGWIAQGRHAAAIAAGERFAIVSIHHLPRHIRCVIAERILNHLMHLTQARIVKLGGIENGGVVERPHRRHDPQAPQIRRRRPGALWPVYRAVLAAAWDRLPWS